jgi:hypothetical protein
MASNLTGNAISKQPVPQVPSTLINLTRELRILVRGELVDIYVKQNKLNWAFSFPLWRVTERPFDWRIDA